MSKSIIGGKGFTLVELVIAFFILMSIGAAFLIALRAGTQESTFLKEQFSAALLSRKVVEDVFAEVEINPWAADGIDFSKARMVDGESHFFSNLEDTKPPFFTIDTGEGNITSDCQPIYSLIEDFQISLKTDLSDPQIRTAKIALDWKSKNSKGRHETEFHYHNTTQQKEIDFPFTIEAGDLEKYICGFLYATQSQPIENILNNPTIGGHKNTIESLGQAGFMTSRFFSSDIYTDTVQEIELLEQEKQGLMSAVSLPGKELDACLKKLVEKRYNLAKISFQVFVFITPYLETIMQNNNQASLGIHFTNPVLLKVLLQNVTRLGDFFTLALWQTIVDLQTYFTPGFSKQISIKKLADNSLRIISLGRLLSFNSIYSKMGKDGKADYLKILNQVETSFKGRFAAMERLVAQEKDFQQNVSAAMAKNPSLANVYEYLKPGGKFSVILKFIKDNYPL